MKSFISTLILTSVVAVVSSSAFADPWTDRRDGIDRGYDKEKKDKQKNVACVQALEDAYSSNHLRHPFVYANDVLVVKTPKGPIAYSDKGETKIGELNVIYDRNKKTNFGLHMLLKDFSEKIDDKSLRHNEALMNQISPCMWMEGAESEKVFVEMWKRAGLPTVNAKSNAPNGRSKSVK